MLMLLLLLLLSSSLLLLLSLLSLLFFPYALPLRSRGRRTAGVGGYNIDRISLLSAFWVVQPLGGWQWWPRIVGGAIRDVLLGVEPSFSKPDLIMAQDSTRFHQVSSGFIRFHQVNPLWCGYYQPVGEKQDKSNRIGHWRRKTEYVCTQRCDDVTWYRHPVPLKQPANL